MRMKFCILFSCVSLFVAGQSVFSATVRELSIPSKSLGSEAKINVVIPDSYRNEKSRTGKRYPVVYLLHGHGDNQEGWPQKGDITGLADEYGVIFVCPDAQKAWYFDSFTNPVLKMESHIVKDVIPYVDKNYRTIPSRKGRAITGNSMGGHGALYLGAKYPNLFGALGSLSGGVDFTPFPNNWNIQDNLGSYAENKKRWETHTAQYLLPKTKKGIYRIIISCGTEDFFLNVNKNLDKSLTEAGIDHEFLTSPGEHNWVYWSKAIKPQVEFFSDFFKNPTPSRTKDNKKLKFFVR